MKKGLGRALCRIASVTNLLDIHSREELYEWLLGIPAALVAGIIVIRL